MFVTSVVLAGALTSPPIVRPEDRSLTSAEYVAEGIPAPDRMWSGRDYIAAAAAIERVAARDPALLPRHASPRSGALFARMTSAENLSFPSYAELPVETRMALALELLPAVQRILVAYVGPAARNIVLDRELAECMGFMMRVGVFMADTAEEFMAARPADDARRPARLEGHAHIRSGLAQILAGGLTSLTEPDTYRPEARRSLARHLQHQVRGIFRHLTDLQRAEAATRLRALAAAETDPEVRASLARAVEDTAPPEP